MDWAVLGWSLGAAVGFAVAAALKHASAKGLQHLDRLTPTAVRHFVTAVVTQRFWWLGTAADVVAVSLHALALRRGALSVVQPLLVTVLVFGLLARGAGQGRVDRREVGWAFVLSSALAGFLVIADSAASADGADVDRGPALAAGVVAVALTGGCVTLARVRFVHGGAAALYGAAAGVVYAGTAALLKALTVVASHGLGAVLTSWQLYTAVAASGAGVVLTQLAYQAGPLAASLPTITIVNPLLSIVVGVVVYDESLRHELGAILAMTVLLLLLGAAVYQLARTEPDGLMTTGR
ncbi:MAG: DMT family transporter [Actinomycetota bacterium]|nr:DMT family transporter [Actinomycetota bacterium]